MQKSIALPSVCSLNLFTKGWNIIPGINDKIFETMKLKLISLALIKRHCVLCAHEISLKIHLFHNISKVEIIEFEDTGDKKSSIQKVLWL